MHDRVAGFGPLQRYLDDPKVEEIWINEPSRVFIARDGRHELTTTVLTEEEVCDLVERMLKTTGRRIDISQPFTDARLPDGSRVHIVLGGITQRYAAINIRKFTVRATRLADLVALGSLTPHAAAVLDAAVAVRAEHPGLRRHPGRQDHDAERAGRLDPRQRAGDQLRGGLRDQAADP